MSLLDEDRNSFFDEEFESDLINFEFAPGGLLSCLNLNDFEVLTRETSELTKEKEQRILSGDSW